MEYKIQISNEKGYIKEYTLNCRDPRKEKNLNDFILDALQISEDKRELPLKILCPNEEETYPSIKLYQECLYGPVDSMFITWQQ